jgi:hypothetical protein
MAEYKRFYEQLYEVKPTASLACGRRFWMPDGVMLDVACLNSSLLQQFDGAFQGQGFIGGPQLDETAREMKWTGNRAKATGFRICMLHHHVVPILHREHPEIAKAPSVVYDAGALMRWLVENDVNLVLHGHMHLPAVVKQKRALDYPKQQEWHEITIAALGSSGVMASHRPTDQSNAYGLIEVTHEGVKLTVRKISADGSILPTQRLLHSITLPYRAS